MSSSNPTIRWRIHRLRWNLKSTTMLRYLRDNTLLGIRFYSDLFREPLMKMLESQKIQQHHAFFGFSDSSWNDDADTGRSTGCFILTYMGGIIDHSSNMPDPVALSSIEAEYNEGCVAFMAASHLRMLLCELEGIEEMNMAPTTMLFDSKSAIAMGSSYRDTKHTRHTGIHTGKGRTSYKPQLENSRYI